MKQFHQLTTSQQMTAKQNAMSEIIDLILIGAMEHEFNYVTQEILDGAFLLKKHGKHEMAKAYLLQSQVFTNSLNEFVEAAASELRYMKA